MQASTLKKMIKTQPFEPLLIGLSDGRLVRINHPDQAVIAERHLLLGLATVERGKSLDTPKSDSVAKDFMLIDLLHIVSVEPVNGQRKKRRSTG